MDLAKARIAGPQVITVDGVNAGHILDGVTISVEREFADVFVDKYGKTPVDKILTATRAMIKFKLAQSDWAQWKVAMPETSSYDGSGTNDRTDIGGEVGTSLRALAKTLVIHPSKRAATDYTDDVTIYKAVSVESLEIPYKVDEQQVIEVTMLALVDESYGAGRRLGHVGPAAVS